MTDQEKKTKKTLGLVVPAYNEEARIAKTLQGLLAQEEVTCNIVVVDNNSSDKTLEIAKTFSVKVVTESKQGYIYAVNRGVEEVDGDYIAICDADTLYPKEWSKNVLACFKRNPDAVAVYGTCSTYDASSLQNALNKWFYTGFLRLSKTLGLHNTSGFNFIMKREAFLKVGGYNPAYKKMSPDIELGKRIAEVGPIVFDSKITVASSFRRYQEGGTLKTQWLFLKSWWAMLRGKEPDISYDEYNIEAS